MPWCANHCRCPPCGPDFFSSSSSSALSSFPQRFRFLLLFFLRSFPLLLASLACLLGLLFSFLLALFGGAFPWSRRCPHAQGRIALRLSNHQHHPPALHHRLHLAAPAPAPLASRVHQAKELLHPGGTAVPQPFPPRWASARVEGRLPCSFLIRLGAPPVRHTTAAIIAFLLSVVYPLFRSPSWRVVSAMLTILGRFRTYCPPALHWGFTLIWHHPCSHSNLQCSSSRCCSIMDLFLLNRCPGSGFLKSSEGVYITKLAAWTASYKQICLRATFCTHAISRQCTIKLSRRKLTARSCAGCSSCISGWTIHVSSPCQSIVTTNEWRLGPEAWRGPSSCGLWCATRKSGMWPVRLAGS